VEIDPARLDMARHNAGIYGVGEGVDFVCADFFAVAPQLAADVVFMSPPWGGPMYRSAGGCGVGGVVWGMAGQHCGTCLARHCLAMPGAWWCCTPLPPAMAPVIACHDACDCLPWRLCLPA